MKYFPRLNMYKASNCTFDPETLTALSYGWWPMLTIINDKLVRNIHNYSPSTGRHQQKLRTLLFNLGIAPDIRLDVRADIRIGSAVAAELAYSWAKEETRLKYARKKQANAWTAQIESARQLGPDYHVTEAMLQQALCSAESNRRQRLDRRPVTYPPLKLVR